MASFELPVVSDGETKEYRFQVDLDGTTFDALFLYNSRSGFWYMSILDPEGNPIRSGIKIVLGFPLLFRIATDGRPLGEMMAVDNENSGIEAGLEDLGSRVILLYGGNA